MSSSLIRPTMAASVFRRCVTRAEGQDDLTFEEMTATLTEAQLMRQKFPEQLEIVDALPRNETLRKVLKFKLRETYSAKPWPG